MCCSEHKTDYRFNLTTFIYYLFIFILFFFFFLGGGGALRRGGERIKMKLKAGHHPPSSETPLKLMTFLWRANDDLKLNAGLVAL